MVRYLMKITSIFLLLMVFLSGCMTKDTSNTVSQDDVIAFYDDFMDLAKDGWSIAVQLYAHYENEVYLESAVNSDVRVLEYEVISTKQLSGKLWEIEVYTESTEIPLGMYCAHYVGIVDGKMRVMISIKNIPEELKEGVELIPYEPHGPGVLGS